MSYFDEMIATERIPDSYVGWEQYRREVTEYIENNCRVKKNPDRMQMQRIQSLCLHCGE